MTISDRSISDHPCRNVFILASDDGTPRGTAPPDSAQPKSIERLQYELLGGQPYRFNKDELDFCVHVMREGLSLREIAVNEAGLRAEFFAEPRPPLRACALVRQYGWGMHIDTNGMIAIHARESGEYGELQRGGEGLRVVAVNA